MRWEGKFPGSSENEKMCVWANIVHVWPINVSPCGWRCIRNCHGCWALQTERGYLTAWLNAVSALWAATLGWQLPCAQCLHWRIFTGRCESLWGSGCSSLNWYLYLTKLVCHSNTGVSSISHFDVWKFNIETELFRKFFVTCSLSGVSFHWLIFFPSNFFLLGSPCTMSLRLLLSYGCSLPIPKEQV